MRITDECIAPNPLHLEAIRVIPNHVLLPDGILKGEGHFGAAVWAPPIRRWTFGRRFLIFFNFSSYEEKTMKQAIP